MVGITVAQSWLISNFIRRFTLDLDAVLALRGWTFSSTDPSTTPEIASRSFPHLDKDLTAGGVVVLTAAEVAASFVKLTGAPALATTVEFPASVDGVGWTLRNETTGGSSTISLRVTGQLVPVLLPPGTILVWSDGATLMAASPLV